MQREKKTSSKSGWCNLMEHHTMRSWCLGLSVNAMSTLSLLNLKWHLFLQVLALPSAVTPIMVHFENNLQSRQISKCQSCIVVWMGKLSFYKMATKVFTDMVSCCVTFIWRNQLSVPSNSLWFLHLMLTEPLTQYRFNQMSKRSSAGMIEVTKSNNYLSYKKLFSLGWYVP